MRVFILLLSLIGFPLAAAAQEAVIDPSAVVETVPDAPVGAPEQSLSTAVPQPRLQAETSVYRVTAIAVGAVAGVVVANAVTGGMITPVLMYGTGTGASSAMVAGGYSAVATQALVTAVGAIGGGYIGNWIYGE